MAGITRFVLAHKRWVVAFWVIVTAIAMVSVSSAVGALSAQFSLPGSEGYKANIVLDRVYGNGGDEAPMVPVVTLPAGTTVDSPGVRDQLGSAFAAMQQAAPSARIVSFASTGDRTFVSKDGGTTYGFIFTRFAGATPPPENDLVKHAARGAMVGGAPVRFTGFEDLENPEGAQSSAGPGVLAETLIGGIGALLILAFVFASFLALVPLVIAICSILTTFLLIWGLTTITEVSFIVQFLVALIGLGVAIDYSLLVVVRWREERAHGLENVAAVQRAMETAGKAVVFSGTTVGIGLLALVVIPVPFLRSIGVGGMLIPFISVLVSITLLPVILATIGPRVDWPRIRREGIASRGWTRWAQGIVHRRVVAAIGALAILTALVAATFTIVVGIPKAETLAQSGEAHDALLALDRAGIGPGPIEPFEVVARGSDPHAAATALAGIAGIRGAMAPDGEHWSRGGTALAVAVPAIALSSSEGRDLIHTVEATIRSLPGEVHVGGTGTFTADFIGEVYGNFPLMIGLIVVITFLLLARAFRSIVLPLKAVLLNVVSVAAAYGIMVLVWQDGHGSKLIWDIDATHAITVWVPVMVFAFLFGLSMDYEVFILARMREEYDATGSTNEAVIRGIGRTGRLVTCAALILFLAFLSLSSGPQTDVKILATGLAAGILLDATVVRALLVPALVSLFGRWNWYLPSFAARVLRVPPHALEPVPVRSDV
ncbi:MAG: MMPL family transporter [Candidatus Dormibacteria bacterium]